MIVVNDDFERNSESSTDQSVDIERQSYIMSLPASPRNTEIDVDLAPIMILPDSLMQLKNKEKPKILE